MLSWKRGLEVWKKGLVTMANKEELDDILNADDEAKQDWTEFLEKLREEKRKEIEDGKRDLE